MRCWRWRCAAARRTRAPAGRAASTPGGCTRCGRSRRTTGRCRCSVIDCRRSIDRECLSTARRARALAEPSPRHRLATVRAFVLTGPGEAGGRGRAADRPRRARSSSMSTASASAAPTSSSSPARWPTCTGPRHFPIRLGHEWCGTVVGRRRRGRPGLARPAGDRRHDARLRRLLPLPARHAPRLRDRYEVGIRGGLPGALAEQLRGAGLVAASRCPTPSTPPRARWSNRAATRCARSRAPAVGAGDRRARARPGTIGLLVALFARAAGAEVHLVGTAPAALDFARTLGFDRSGPTGRRCPTCRSTRSSTRPTRRTLPALALELVEPGGRVVYIGLSGSRA